ncbi:hypothetical protein AB0X45_08345 [Limosilactobacillus reuteri]|uniref:hypothetical protein n=1 Tax=Bacilli TaxID=91061 RepID=UPI003F2090CF
MEQLTSRFAKHVVVTDLFVLIGLIINNLFSFIIPIVRIRIGGIIILLLVIDACLVGVKLVNNFNFGPNR